jgi:hypothetical protein
MMKRIEVSMKPRVERSTLLMLGVSLLLLFGLQSGAQTTPGTDPTRAPLVQARNLKWVGAFRLPGGHYGTPNGFSFGGKPLAYNPANNSLFVGGHSYDKGIAEVTIPTPVPSTDVAALPFAAVLQPLSDPTEGKIWQLTTVNGVELGGLLVANGTLVGTAYVYYDADASQRAAHYTRALKLSTPSVRGFYAVGNAGTGFVSGWLGAVPQEWQPLLGGAALTGQCCVPIISRTSWGPAVFSFNPAALTGSPPGSVPAIPVVYYPSDHPTLGPYDQQSQVWNGSTTIGGFAIPRGTRSLLFFGKMGTGAFCYGGGTDTQALAGKPDGEGGNYCYDPMDSSKGTHAFPYREQVWAYDLNDLAAVKRGAMQPWDVKPYATWFPDFQPAGVDIGGVAYDAEHQLIYVSQLRVDADGFEYRPLIHAFRIE